MSVVREREEGVPVMLSESAAFVFPSDVQRVKVVFPSVRFPLSPILMNIAPPVPFKQEHSSKVIFLSVAHTPDAMFDSITPPLPLSLVIDVKVQFCIELAVLMGMVMSGLFSSVKLANVLLPQEMNVDLSEKERSDDVSVTPLVLLNDMFSSVSVPFGLMLTNVFPFCISTQNDFSVSVRREKTVRNDVSIDASDGTTKTISSSMLSALRMVTGHEAMLMGE